MYLYTTFDGAADFVVDHRRIPLCDVVGVVNVVLVCRQLPLGAHLASQSLILSFELKLLHQP